MTRKDHTRIANALRQAKAKVAKCAGAADLSGPSERVLLNRGVCFAAVCIYRALAEDNPRFNLQHFLAVLNG